MTFFGKFFIGTALFLMPCALLLAQTLSMSNTQIEHHDKTRTGIRVVIAPDEDDVRDEFKDWLKDKYGFKLRGNGFLTNKDVMYAEGVQLDAISPNKMDFYAKIVEGENDRTEMTVFASFGYSIHVTPERFPAEYRALEDLTLNFLEDYLTEFYRERVEEKQEMVGDLEKKRKELREEITENEEEIVELREENVELEQEIIEKGSKLEEANAQLQDNRQSLDAVQQQLARKKADAQDNDRK